MNKLIAAVVIALGFVSPTLAEDRTINVTGQGTVEAPPDMATMTIGVTRTAPEAAAALAETSQAIASVIARLEDLDVAPRDMQTSGLALQPVWSRPVSNGAERREITGFAARNQLTIRVRALDDLGDILDAVVQDGANTFDGLRFSLSDPSEAVAGARAAAVRDAMRKAEQLAAAADMSLGEVLTISENDGAPRPVQMELAAARMADSVPVATGEVSLTVTVSMRFAIEDE